MFLSFCRLPLAALTAILLITSAGTQTPTNGWPLTRAEKSNYEETSHYEDVIEFIEGLQGKGAPVSLEYIGTSTEGKKIPLVIASRPLVSSPAEARRMGRPIVYI